MQVQVLKMLVKALGTKLYRQFGTSATCNRSFTLSYIIPDKSNQVKTRTFVSAKDFRASFPGFTFTNPKNNETFAAAFLPHHVNPTVTYIAEHPFLPARLEGYSHNQISDKAFEDKACNALERYLKKSLVISRRVPDNPTRLGGWRFLTGEKDIAEWEGVWESCDGHHFFLEAKHLMDMASFFSFMILSILLTYTQNKFLEIQRKLMRSVDFLGIDRSKAAVYVAGNHWLDEDAIQEARTKYGFGILACNGLNLDVQEPITG
jgi:hypothetical protein